MDSASTAAPRSEGLVGGGRKSWNRPPGGSSAIRKRYSGTEAHNGFREARQRRVTHRHRSVARNPSPEALNDDDVRSDLRSRVHQDVTIIQRYSETPSHSRPESRDYLNLAVRGSLPQDAEPVDSA